MRINEVYKNNNNGGGGVRAGHRNRTRGASLSRAEADDIDSANIDLATRNKNQSRELGAHGDVSRRQLYDWRRRSFLPASGRDRECRWQLVLPSDSITVIRTQW
jgi:hypothetical protein